MRAAPPHSYTQVVAPAPPRWEAEYKAWEKDMDLRQGYLKEYPDVVSERWCGVSAEGDELLAPDGGLLLL